jgi:hypothetical protein
LENPLLLLKVVAVAHGVLGYVGFFFALSPEFQEEIIYKGRNPLIGDIKKYLVYLNCFLLLICALSAWFKPATTPLWAWLALTAYLLGGAIDLIAQRGRLWCWRCRASGVILKAIGAGALTYLAMAYGSSANA